MAKSGTERQMPLLAVLQYKMPGTNKTKTPDLIDQDYVITV